MAETARDMLIRLTVEATEASRNTKQLADEMGKLAAASEAANEKMTQINQQSKGMTSGMAGSAKDLEGIGGALDRAFGKGANYQIINVSNQLQDFIVQVNGGMDATRALSQQLPQLLGAFGALGAAAGIAAAVLPQIASALFSVGAAESALKAVAEQSKALSDALGFVDRMTKEFDPNAFLLKLDTMDVKTKELTFSVLKFGRAQAIVFGQEAQRNLEKAASSYQNIAKHRGAWSINSSGVILSEAESWGRQFDISAEAGAKLAEAVREITSETGNAARGIDLLTSITDKGNAKLTELSKNLYASGKERAVAQKDLNLLEQQEALLAQSIAGRKGIPKEKGGGSRATEQNDYNRLLKELSDQLIKINQGPGSISALTTLNEQYRRGLIKLLPAQLEDLRIVAQKIDSEKELQALTKDALARDEVRNKAQAEINAEWLKNEEATQEARRKANFETWKTNQALDAQISKMEDAVEPLRVYHRTIEELYKLMARGMSLEAFVKGAEAAQEQLDKSRGVIKDVKEELTELQKSLQQLATQGIGGLADVLVSADRNFRQFAENFLRQVAKMIIQTTLLKSLAGTSIGGILGLQTPGKKSAPGLESGGYMSRAGAGIPALFGGAGGAEIVSAGQSSAGVSVNVVNNAGAEIGVESRQNADGSTMIDILVERKVKGMIASGAMDRVMASTFGARRRGFA
jgi:hypothetical protein